MGTKIQFDFNLIQLFQLKCIEFDNITTVELNCTRIITDTKTRCIGKNMFMEICRSDAPNCFIIIVMTDDHISQLVQLSFSTFWWINGLIKIKIVFATWLENRYYLF